jgi:preprotein translocase subunit YajC
MKETLLINIIGQSQPTAGFGQLLIPLVFFFLIFYFLLIRPQQKRMKAHREFLNKLKKGDEVITSSGIYGKVIGISDRTVLLEIDKDVKIKIDKSYIQGYWIEEKKEDKK